MEDPVELARQRKGQAPPPWLMAEALRDPLDPQRRRPWFDVQPGEAPPVVLHQEDSRVVVWSSIWLDQPDLRIRFELEPGGGGSIVTWILLGPGDRLDAEDIRRRRYRLNKLINGQLRDAFDM